MERDRLEAFSHLLSSSQRSLTKIKSRGMSPFGLGSTHTMCMRKLFDNPDGLTRKELSELCDLDKALITRVVGELSAKGYTVESGEKTAYRRKVFLTEDGKKVTSEINDIVKNILSFVSGNIPDEQLDTFYETFSVICENLKQAEELV